MRAPLSSQPPLAPIVARPHGRLVVPTPCGRGERSRHSPRSLFLRGCRPASSQPERQRSVFDFAGRQPRRKRRLGRQLFALSSQQRASACLAFLQRSALRSSALYARFAVCACSLRSFVGGFRPLTPDFRLALGSGRNCCAGQWKTMLTTFAPRKASRALRCGRFAP